MVALSGIMTLSGPIIPLSVLTNVSTSVTIVIAFQTLNYLLAINIEGVMHIIQIINVIGNLCQTLCNISVIGLLLKLLVT